MKTKIKTGEDTTKFDREKANEVRNLIQFNVVQSFLNSRRILLTWATGCGKSLASLKMIKEYYDFNNDIKGYLICKEHSHLSNWNEDIAKHKMNYIHKCSQMFLYDSLHKYSDHGYVDFVILDECHAITDLRLSHLMKIVGPETAVILLSATVTQDKLELINVLCRNSYASSDISISEAIQKGILPPPKVYAHFYSLDDTIVNQVFVYEQGSKKGRKKMKCSFIDAKKYIGIYPNLELSVSCTQKQHYQLVSAEMGKYKNMFIFSKAAWAKARWTNLGSERKRIMAHAKTLYASELLKKEFKNSRFICFTGSKKQCEKLGGKQFVHSDLTKKDVVSKKDAFNDGKIDKLFVVNMFRENVNLVDVEKGLIVQLDNVKLTFIQMLGRVFRSDVPEMHIMILKDTQDEKYYKNVMKGFNKEYLTVINH